VFRQGHGEDTSPYKNEELERSRFRFIELSLVDQYGLPFLRVYKRIFERGHQDFYIELAAIPREKDTEYPHGAMIFRYSDKGIIETSPKGYGSIDERKILKDKHPYLQQVPQKIYFRKTFKGFIEQANNESFELPKLFLPKSRPVVPNRFAQ